MAARNQPPELTATPGVATTILPRPEQEQQTDVESSTDESSSDDDEPLALACRPTAREAQTSSSEIDVVSEHRSPVPPPNLRRTDPLWDFVHQNNGQNMPNLAAAIRLVIAQTGNGGVRSASPWFFQTPLEVQTSFDNPISVVMRTELHGDDQQPIGEIWLIRTSFRDSDTDEEED